MEYRKVSGAVACTLIAAISISSAYSYIGDIWEKAISFSSSVFTFLVIVALLGIWKGYKLLKPLQVKVIVIGYLVSTLLTYLYPLFEYSEQVPPSNWFFLLGIDLTVAFVVSSLLWRNK
ncbi:hypothetical protein [Vibrio sp. TRT 17S01]|uniref:hypothetical protein n=1 Tax=Vibrio sp. TRT 17S01 TaxID=3418505 RepID=UPI003CF022CA